MKHMGRVTLLLVLAAFGGIAAAQEKTPGNEEVIVSPKAHMSLGAGFGGPLGAAVDAELIYGLGADVRDGAERIRGSAGVLVQVQAGSGGGKLSLGVGGHARIDEDDFRGAVGAGLKLSLARTWRAPVGTDPGLTYLGPEIALSAKHVALSLGTLFRVGGAGGRGVLFCWGVGLRL